MSNDREEPSDADLDAVIARRGAPILSTASEQRMRVDRPTAAASILARDDVNDAAEAIEWLCVRAYIPRRVKAALTAHAVETGSTVPRLIIQALHESQRLRRAGVRFELDELSARPPGERSRGRPIGSTDTVPRKRQKPDGLPG